MGIAADDSDSALMRLALALLFFETGFGDFKEYVRASKPSK
jgi:hypothetical protein